MQSPNDETMLALVQSLEHKLDIVMDFLGLPGLTGYQDDSNGTEVNKTHVVEESYDKFVSSYRVDLFPGSSIDILRSSQDLIEAQNASLGILKGVIDNMSKTMVSLPLVSSMPPPSCKAQETAMDEAGTRMGTDDLKASFKGCISSFAQAVKKDLEEAEEKQQNLRARLERIETGAVFMDGEYFAKLSESMKSDQFSMAFVAALKMELVDSETESRSNDEMTPFEHSIEDVAYESYHDSFLTGQDLRRLQQLSKAQFFLWQPSIEEDLDEDPSCDWPLLNSRDDFEF